MKTALSILAIFFLCNLSAQNPCAGCWGTTSIPVLSDSDRVALRLSSPEKPLKWYSFRTYKFKGGGKRIVWASYIVAGVLHGGREAYHAEPTVFEKRFGVSETSFFGSKQWVRQYQDSNPELPHKNNLFNGFRDYWHFSGATTKYLLIGGAFTIGHSKQPLKYKILDTLLGFAGFSLTANLTYNILR